MSQQTLLSLYGKKPEMLQKFLAGIQEIIMNNLAESLLKPYPPDQIHGTLIGLETIEIDGSLYNRNLWENEKKKLPMDLSSLNTVIDRHFPMQIRFGGFSPDDSSFLSRGERPFLRSFKIDIQNRRIVLIGWPHRKGDFSGQYLWNFREEVKENCNIAHKYHRDNDFYMVLGELLFINKELIEEKKINTEKEVRTFLMENPIELPIHELSLAAYIDPRLPVDSTDINPLRVL